MNPANTLTMYDYQGFKVDSAHGHVKAGRDVVLEEPTGAGKTFQGVTILALAVTAKVVTHAIVIAPQCQIEAGFVGYNDSTALWPESMGRSEPIVIPPGFVRTARAGKRGSAAEILAYLATPNPGYALATTHGAMRTLFKLRMAEFPERLDGCLLFVDEAHHVGAERLTVVTEEWFARGGRQIGATATPYRGDGIDPVREGTIRLRRTITEQIDAGFAPASLGNEIVAIGAKGDRVTGKEFAGEDASAGHFEQIAVLMTGKWIEKGKPKTIIRVPPMRGGNGGLVVELKRRLRKAGARVFDATGANKEQQKRFLAMLDTERKRSFAESQYDVVIGCMRVLEGSDWPVCSHVFSLGIPRPIGTVIQLIGRAMRKKAADHPSANRAEVVFFVPCAGGEALANLGLDHSRHALLVAAYMADYAVGEEYAVVDAIRKGLGIKPGDDLEIEVDKAVRIDPMLVAEAKAHITQAVEDRPEITLTELVDLVANVMPDASRNNVVGIVLRIKASAKTKEGRDVKAAIEAGFAVSDKVRPDIAEERRRVFDEVLETFRDETLADSEGLNAFAAQIHTLTAGGMRSVVERLKGSRPLQALPETNGLVGQGAELLLRKAPNVMEQAKAFRSLMAANGCSARELARKLDFSVAHVCRFLSILELPSEVQDMVERAELGVSTAYELGRLLDKEAMKRLAAEASSHGMTRDQVAGVVRRTLRSNGRKEMRRYRSNKTGAIKRRNIRTSFGNVTVDLRSLGDAREVVMVLREAIRQIENEIVESREQASA